MLMIHNTLTKQKELLKPLHPGKVSIYVCGNTVYDYCHIGHARSMISFDNIVRYLRWSGLDVTYVRNITDVDDKIIKRANENNETCDALTERMIAAQREDEKALGLLSPNQEPRATDHMDEIVAMVSRLIENGKAYVAKNGDVCYKVRAFEGYGKLSHRDIEELQSGARVEVVSEKEDPLDFVLWKLAKPGEPRWPSPWGEGRPGWHIECSAMSTKCLGNHFDIHGGGYDLVFPHHENEIAQSEGATGETFVNTWIHVGYLQINKEKMSKSLGNFFTIREVLEKYPAEVLRYFMAASHYRSPLNYSEEALVQSRQSLETLYIALRDLPKASPCKDTDYARRYKEAMDDDFNTSVAVSVLFDCANDINKLKTTDPEKAAGLGALLRELGANLGILQLSAETFLQQSDDVDVAAIEKLIEARDQARHEKDWARSDKIRDELAAMGVQLEDSAGRTTWRRG